MPLPITICLCCSNIYIFIPLALTLCFIAFYILVSLLDYCFDRFSDRFENEEEGDDRDLETGDIDDERWSYFVGGLLPTKRDDLKDGVALSRYRDSQLMRWGECAICCEEFEAGEACSVLKLCKHDFHHSCIEKWLIKNQTCPICRNKMV